LLTEAVSRDTELLLREPDQHEQPEKPADTYTDSPPLSQQQHQLLPKSRLTVASGEAEILKL
jgi:hypothetical protein